MKLELKHLAGYLPYGLKIYACHNEYLLELEEDCNSEGISVRETIENDHKPILRPLSDLTKEIEVNGEKINFPELFFPCDEFDKLIGFNSLKYSEEFIDSGNCLELCYPFDFWNLLYQHHFDIFGIIPKGLAISIND